MTRDVTIKVLQHHIDEGKTGSTYECPVALAVADALPGCIVAVSFAETSVWAPDGTFAGSAANPWEVRHFIEYFDDYGLRGMRRDHFRPFTFTLALSPREP